MLRCTLLLAAVFVYTLGALISCEQREQNYQHTLQRVKDARQRINSDPLYHRVPFVWYLAEPVWNCETITRVGTAIGDGAKYMCDLERLVARGNNCVYYGFGVNGDVEFEKDLTRYLRCEHMYAFDPTPSVTHDHSGYGSVATLKNLGVEFMPIGISDTDGMITLENHLVPANTLDSIRAKLGHSNRVIDILKIDVEGAEWNVLFNIFSRCDRRAPLTFQLLVEVHGITRTLLERLLGGAANCGYRLFTKDPNHNDNRVYELAFVHESFIACK